MKKQFKIAIVNSIFKIFFKKIFKCKFSTPFPSPNHPVQRIMVRPRRDRTMMYRHTKSGIWRQMYDATSAWLSVAVGIRAGQPGEVESWCHKTRDIPGGQIRPPFPHDSCFGDDSVADSEKIWL